MLMLVPLLAGAIAGRACGGRLARIGDLRFRAPVLIFAVLASQALLGRAPSRFRALAVMVSYVAVGAWIIMNMNRRALGLRLGFALVGLGWALNFAAMAPSGAMPVSAEALRAVGAPITMDVQEGHLYKHVRRNARNATTWLGDEIPVPPLRAVISVGDIVLGLGIVLLVASAMLRHAPAPVRRGQYGPRRKGISSALRAPGASSGIQWLTPSSSTNS